MRPVSLFGALVPLVFLAAATAAEAGERWFTSEATERGLDFVHDTGRNGRYLMPEAMIGGAALCDLNGDGHLDAYFVQGGLLDGPAADRPPNRLFFNRGDGTFVDATEASRAGNRGYGSGVTCGDYDGDGDTDLYVTNLGPNALLRNRGDGVFDDVSDASGVADPGWGSSSAFVDYDRDGDLDLFVVNYLNWTVATELRCFDSASAPEYCGPVTYSRPAQDALYRNNGDGTFTDVTVEAGLGSAPATGLGIVIEDFDRDGNVDIFVANDGMQDHLWLNDGAGAFLEEGMFRGCGSDLDGKLKAGMGVAVADLDGDGWPDLLVGNLAQESDSLYLNRNGYFVDQTASSGLARLSRINTRFGLGLIDFDNDGWIDLFEANGKVTRQGKQYTEDPYAEPDLMLKGVPSGVRFELVADGVPAPEVPAYNSRAAAFGDIDSDGDVDILVLNNTAPAVLLVNQVGAGNPHLRLSVTEREGAPALGALVVLPELGRRVRVRTAYSYLASSEPIVHVGLGELAPPRRAEVTWTDGEQECFEWQGGDGVIELRRGRGTTCRTAP